MYLQLYRNLHNSQYMWLILILCNHSSNNGNLQKLTSLLLNLAGSEGLEPSVFRLTGERIYHLCLLPKFYLNTLKCCLNLP